jgi:hypothetical protein
VPDRPLAGVGEELVGALKDAGQEARTDVVRLLAGAVACQEGRAFGSD